VFFGIVLAATSASAQPAANDAAPAIDWSEADVIEITLTNYAFAPTTLQLHRNTPYRLHFVNKGSSDHSFTSKELLAAVMVAPDDRAKIKKDEIEIPKGKSVDVTVLPLAAGTYPFHCSHFLHASFGMHGQANIGE